MSPANRRHFLQATSIGITSGLTASLFGARTCRASEDRFRVGIIGSTGRGDYGHGIDVAFTKIPEVEIIALADDSPKGLQAAAERTHPQATYTDYHEMLANEKLDIVAICPRWIDQHHDMIITAAQAGCHIYMEKPFCPTLLECDNAVAQLGEKNLKLGIAHTTQYSPILDVVGSLIENDEIGELLELRARGKEDHRGGGEDLWVLGSHLFGMMRTLTGENATQCYSVVRQDGHSVTAADVKKGAEGIGLLAGDQIQAQFEFASGVTGYFASKKSLAGSPSRFAMQIFGSKGIIEMETGYLTSAHLLRDSSWSPGRTRKVWEPITSAGIGKAEPRTDANYEGGHIAAIQDLIAAIRDDRPTKCSAIDCRAIIEMIVAVFASHVARQAVELPLAIRSNPLVDLGKHG